MRGGKKVHVKMILERGSRCNSKILHVFPVPTNETKMHVQMAEI